MPSTTTSTSARSGPLTDQEAGVKAKELVARFAAGKLDEAIATFDPAMVAAFPKEKASETWNKLVEQAGPFKSAQVAKTEHKDKYIRVTVETEFEKATLDLAVVLDQEGRISGFFVAPRKPDIPWNPPSYAKQDAFGEEEVKVGEGDFALPGTLALPKGDADKKLPAVVLVHGSGPNDRDESLGGLKPFKDIAWGLASRGIIVLRYEKVTRVHGAKWAAKVGEEITLRNETIDDALLGVALLRKHPRVDPKRIYWFGHSQGAWAAPRAGTMDKDLAGMVIAAGPTRPLEDVGLSQIEYISTIPGPNGEGAKKLLPTMQEAVKLVKSKSLDAKTPKDKLPLGIPAPFWLDVRDYKPHEVAAKLNMRVLVLQGEADYQVTMVDFDGWKKALGGKKNATLKSYPRLSHAFVDCGRDRAVPEDYAKAGNVADAVVEDLVKWIQSP